MLHVVPSTMLHHCSSASMLFATYSVCRDVYAILYACARGESEGQALRACWVRPVWAVAQITPAVAASHVLHLAQPTQLGWLPLPPPTQRPVCSLGSAELRILLASYKQHVETQTTRNGYCCVSGNEERWCIINPTINYTQKWLLKVL